ncbi:hypothetical protein BDF14DRAFT_1755021 [Spinellus fusiger]|nr:hypothetical protein BDF14DRAFT_1755021 [Spinellus fusiger]
MNYSPIKLSRFIFALFILQLSVYCTLAVSTTSLPGPISSHTDGVICIQRVCPTQEAAQSVCPSTCTHGCHRKNDVCCTDLFTMVCNDSASQVPSTAGTGTTKISVPGTVITQPTHSTTIPLPLSTLPTVTTPTTSTTSIMVSPTSTSSPQSPGNNAVSTVFSVPLMAFSLIASLAVILSL